MKMMLLASRSASKSACEIRFEMKSATVVHSVIALDYNSVNCFPTGHNNNQQDTISHLIRRSLNQCLHRSEMNAPKAKLNWHIAQTFGQPMGMAWSVRQPSQPSAGINYVWRPNFGQLVFCAAFPNCTMHLLAM